LSSNVTETTTAKIKFSTKILGLDTAGTFTASIVDIDNVCSNIGTPKNFVSPNLLQQFTDSIDYTLNSMNVGTTYRLLLKIENGPFARVDTLSFIFGSGGVAYNDPCTTTDGWVSESGSWLTTTSTFVTAPSAITDGIGNYSDNSSKSITTTTSVDLTQATMAQLSYFAKWSIEQDFDYVQILASDDNSGNWLPLCGKYTTEGGVNQAAAQGQPVYQGSQLNWVAEQIDLSNYLGKQVKFRFTLVSDGGVNDDGFYFDDFKVIKFNNTGQSIAEAGEPFSLSVAPNPSTGMVSVKINSNEAIRSIEVINMLGATVFMDNSGNKTATLNLSQLPKGSYFIKVTTEKMDGVYRKIVLL